MAELRMSDEKRRQELNGKFEQLIGWSGDEAYRIAEKENDAARISAKLLSQLENLLINTSLLAVPNDLLSELLKQSQTFTAELKAEARRRA